MGLRVEADGDNVRLTWNRQAPILAQATGGILHIEDGSEPREIRLTREQLKDGSIAYAHSTGTLHFRLDVLVGESVSAFVGDKTASALKTQTDPPAEEAVRRPAGVQPGNVGETGQIAEQRAAAPQAGMRQRSDEALGLSTASGETGIASFYHLGSDRDELTAAYSKLPVGTSVLVTNLANGRSVVVRITTRGPSANRTRIINVSYRAAEELGFVRAGTARVRVAPILP